MKKGKTLFIFCDGTDHDLKDDSIVARYYKLLQARAIDIRPYYSEQFKSILDGLQGEIFSADPQEKFAHDKLYLRGCGSATNTPGKNSPVLGKDKETVKSFLNNSTDVGDFGEDFYGVNTPIVNGPVSRVVKGLAEGEGRYDNVHKACAIIAAKLGNRGFQTQNKPVKPLEINDKLLLAKNGGDEKIEEEKDETDEYTKIVLVGWSRGAVTADHIRKQLFDMGITIPVCSFQIDAVAGQNSGLTDENTRCYSPAELDVRLFTRGDERQEFHPQTLERVHDIPELLANPNMPYYRLSSIKAYPVYGSHSQVAGSAKGDASRTVSPPAMITEKLLVEFFNKAIGEEETRQILGPKVDQHTYPTKQFIELYSLTQVVPNHFEYKLGKSLFSADKIYKKEERPFISELDKYIQHSEFFVNSDHEEKFAQCYPDLYAKIDTLTNSNIAEILETKGLDQCSKTVFISAILFKALDEQIKKIPSHKIYAQFLESMRSVRREIQKEIYTEISSAKKTPQEIQTRLTEVIKHSSIDIAEEITKIVTENIPPALRKPSLPDSPKEPETKAAKLEPIVLKSANPIAHLIKIKSKIETSQELFPGEQNKFMPVKKLLQAAVAAASIVLKIVCGFFGALAGPVGLKAGVKTAERCSGRMYNSLFSPKKRSALNLADKAIAAANSASALRTPQQ